MRGFTLSPRFCRDGKERPGLMIEGYTGAELVTMARWLINHHPDSLWFCEGFMYRDHQESEYKKPQQNLQYLERESRGREDKTITETFIFADIDDATLVRMKF